MLNFSTTTLSEEYLTLCQKHQSARIRGRGRFEDEIVVSKIPANSEAPSIEPRTSKIELSSIPAIDEENEDVEQPTRDLSTTCTMCSICIDEFEVGEKITLLPGGASMPSMGFASAHG
jgi:hypothetical protein